MIKRLKRLFATSLMLALVSANLFATSPKREMRSTWLTTVWGIDWPSTQGSSSSAQSSQKSELRGFLDDLEAANFTSTCFQVRSMGDAMYPSQYAPWSSYVSGSRGTSPGWDPLAYFVEEAHKRGLEAYVWLNPYRWSSGTSWSTSLDKEWQNNNMLIAGTENTSYYTFNPGLPETRELIVNIIKEILENYNIDGIIFDDYFYPSGGTTEGSSAPDYDTYKASGTTLSMGDWRRANVNQMVKDVYDAIQATRPDVRFGISPAGVSSMSASKYGLKTPSSYGVSASDWQYDQIYSDPLAWMAEGTIDFISPQCYWLTSHSTAPFGPLTKWWSYAANELGKCHYYASHSASYIGSSDTQSNWVEMVNQINYNREYTQDGAFGSIYYSHTSVTDGLRNLMTQDVYSRPALVPVIDWKAKTNYDKVANLSYNNGTLSWTETTNGNAIIRYTVYAVPMSVTIDEAKAADGDGFDVQYLQKVVYGGSYTLASDKQNNYWYAVSVYDGYGNEHAAAIVNYPEGASENTTLISPINGAVTDWVQTFTWSAVEDATYVLEISDTQAFTVVENQVRNLTSNSAEVDLGNLEANKTYYWRVRTSQTNKLEAVSDVATFKTGTRPSAPKTTLQSPANGAEMEDDFTMTWAAVDCEQYILEVSTASDFSTIKYTQTLTTNSHEMKISLLGKGTFYWRVTTAGRYLTSTVSDVASFTITKVSVGNYEPGYQILIDKDNASYEPSGDIEVNSIWFRSVESDYANISFENNGSLTRSFCVGNDYVYMTGRSANSSSASIYIRKYDQKTGEIVSDIILSDDGKVGYYSCNTVACDTKGNICMANMTLNSSNSIKLWQVDTETGELALKADVYPSVSSSARLDHISVTGDVSTGNFKLYAAIKDTKYVVRWTYENGSQTKEETCTLQSMYPSSSTNLHTAPRVFPIDDNTFFVNGGTSYLSKYEFATNATLLDSFEKNSTLAPIGLEGNGGTFFTLNGTNYVVYPYSDYNNGGYTFNVVKTDADMSFSSMELMWNLPQDGLGDVNSTTYQAEAGYLPVNGNSGILYLFVPGNGICAYEIKDNGPSGVESIIADNSGMQINGNVIQFSSKASMVSIYNMMGMVEKVCANVSEVELNLPNGVYVINAMINGTIYREKIVVR